MDLKDKIKKQYVTTLLIGSSIIFSIFIYPVIAEIIRFQNMPFHGFSSMTNIPIIHYGIFGLGLLPLIILNYLKDIFFNNSSSQNIDVTLGKLKTFALITFAICEIPAICGFVLFLLWGLMFDFIILIGISLILEFKNFPRLSQWEEIIGSQSQL